MILLAILLVLESLTFASPPALTPQGLVLYRDCVSEETPSIPIFAEWKDETDKKIKETEVPSQYYTNGIQISVIQDESGQIAGVQLGDQISIPLTGLRPGIRFGALNSVIHTLEAEPGFDPKTGGIIRFGFYKNFEPSQVLRDLGHPTNRRATLGPIESVSAYQKELKGAQWGEKRYRLSKENGQWVLMDMKSSKQVHAIYTVMKTEPLIRLGRSKHSFLRMITGLTTMVNEYITGYPLECSGIEPSEMMSDSEGRKIPVMRSVIEDPDGQKNYVCVTK